jgi:hypothetical protein
MRIKNIKVKVCGLRLVTKKNGLPIKSLKNWSRTVAVHYDSLMNDIGQVADEQNKMADHTYQRTKFKKRNRDGRHRFRFFEIIKCFE